MGNQDVHWDCVVVGGGPAGLTAAVYLARFHLSAIVIDSGGGRARSIPCSRNVPGFPKGIAGAELIDRMRAQAATYGANFATMKIGHVNRHETGFILSSDNHSLRARTVLLATGVVNRIPVGMDPQVHEAALAAGLVRYCPICDGFEVTDKRVAVLGSGGHAMREAEFLRSYTKNVTLIGSEIDAFRDEALVDRAKRASINILRGPCEKISIKGKFVEINLPEGQCDFEALYAALGSVPQSDLARSLKAVTTNDGCVVVDHHQRTSVRHLYAAGDVVLGLDQISNAMGGGGVAATTVRNDLAAIKCLAR